MGIIYFLTVLALITLFMLLKKTEKKLNGIIWGVISTVILLSYNIFVSYILNTVKIPITLLSLLIVNIITSIGMLIYIVRKKEIQKYYIDKIDILYLVLLFIICLVVSRAQFGEYPFRIKYQTTDPYRHCSNAIRFAEESKLIRNDTSWKVERPGAYINTGIAMKMFINNFERIDLYNIFVAYDIFILFLTGTSMYVMMKNVSKNKFLTFIAFVFSLLYVLGYPFNSMIFGFSYLSLAIPIINAIIFMMEIFEEKNVKIIQWVVSVFLLNFAVFFSYYLFIPFLYGAEFIYFNIKSYKNEKKLFTKKNILLILITLIIPTIISLIFFNFGIQVQDKGSGIAYNMALYGYAYINKYSDILLLIPLSIYTIIKERKDNKFTTIMFILLLVYILLMYIANKFDLITIYFIMKNYYVVWGLLFYLTYKAIVELQDKNKYLPGIITVMYVFLCLNIGYVSEIYSANAVMTLIETSDSRTVYTNKEVRFLDEIQEKIDFSKNVYFIGDEKKNLWAKTLINYKQPKTDKKMENEDIVNDYENVDYIIYFKRDEYLLEYEEKLYTNRKIIYETEEGVVLKKIK